MSQTGSLLSYFYLLFQGKPSSKPKKQDDTGTGDVRSKEGEGAAGAASCCHAVRVRGASRCQEALLGLRSVSLADARGQEVPGDWTTGKVIFSKRGNVKIIGGGRKLLIWVWK